MANKKLTQLTEDTSPNASDIIYSVRDPSGSPLDRKVTFTNAVASVGVLKDGVSGGQTIIGGTGSGDDLTLQSTSNATKGSIIFGSASAYDEANDRLGIGDTTPADKLSVTVADTDNVIGCVVTQNDVTNNPAAVSIVNTGTGDSLFINTDGDATSIDIDSEASSTSVVNIEGQNTSQYLVFARNNAAQTSQAAAVLWQDNASTSTPCVQVRHDGTGTGMFLDQNGNGIALDIDHEGTSTNAIRLFSASTNNIVDLVAEAELDSLRSILDVYTNVAQTTATRASNLQVVSDNSGSTSAVATIINDGSGASMVYDKNNSGNVISIDQDVNNANACVGLQMNIANSGAGLEYAFKFDGAEIVNAAVGGSQDKKIRIDIAGTDYFIPCNTA